MDKLCECGCGLLAPVCKKSGDGYRRGEPKKFIQGHSSRNRKRERSNRWTGGRALNHNGYVMIMAPEHPRANKAGYVFEHILVLEKALGRPILPTEHPHHINSDKTDNSPGNLMVFQTNGMHRSFHERLKAYEECGHWDWRKCVFCHQFDAPSNLITRGKGCCHRSCENANHRERGW